MKFPHLSDIMYSWGPNTTELYDFVNSDFIYARFKERHLVPDHTLNIPGACFDGFYCISHGFDELIVDVSYQRSTGTIVGWYYHENSEP